MDAITESEQSVAGRGRNDSSATFMERPDFEPRASYTSGGRDSLMSSQSFTKMAKSAGRPSL